MAAANTRPAITKKALPLTNRCYPCQAMEVAKIMQPWRHSSKPLKPSLSGGTVSPPAGELTLPSSNTSTASKTCTAEIHILAASAHWLCKQRHPNNAPSAPVRKRYKYKTTRAGDICRGSLQTNSGQFAEIDRGASVAALWVEAAPALQIGAQVSASIGRNGMANIVRDLGLSL